MERFIRKRWLIILALIFAFVVVASQVQAADKIFCKGMTGTGEGATLGVTSNYGAFIAIPGDASNQTVIASLSITSDGTTRNAYVYDKESEATINAAAAAGATEITITPSGTSPFDNGDIVVLQDPSGKRVYVETVASYGAATVALSGHLDGAIAIGWKVYEMEKICEIPAGNATASYQSDVAVVAGTQGSPVLIWIGGVAGCSINFASGHYR